MTGDAAVIRMVRNRGLAVTAIARNAWSENWRLWENRFSSRSGVNWVVIPRARFIRLSRRQKKSESSIPPWPQMIALPPDQSRS